MGMWSNSKFMECEVDIMIIQEFNNESYYYREKN